MRKFTALLLPHLAACLFFMTTLCATPRCAELSPSPDSVNGQHSDQPAQTGQQPPSQPEPDNIPPDNFPSDIVVQPKEENLTPEATETYAYLLMIQAILDEDEAGVLDVAPLLEKCKAPATVWLDGGIWLMSRKSSTAIPFLEQSLKMYPDDLSMSLLYAEALGDHGLASRGVEYMRNFMKKHPDIMDARLELALLLVKDKQFEEAQKLLNQIPAKQRTSLVDYYQAKALLGMNKRSEAIGYLRKAVKGMPDFVEALADLAFALEQDGNLREARSTYEKLQKLHFSPHDVALRLINLSLKLKQPEKALQYIRQGPNSLSFRLTAANMLLQSRHYLQAENILKQIADTPDAPVEVYLLLADIVYEQRRNLNMALGWLNKIPADKPGVEKGALLRVQLLAEAGKMADALVEAAKAQEEYPDFSAIADFRIRLLAREKKIAEALALARKSLEKWPDNSQLSFLLASLLDESGDKKQAMATMEKIITKEPDNFQALNYVGFTLAEENRDLERALKLLTKANELSPDQAYIIDSLAWALYRSGKYGEALREIKRAVKLGENSGDAAIWDHYGDIAIKNGLRDEARRAWRKAIELKPSNADAIRKKLAK